MKCFVLMANGAVANLEATFSNPKDFANFQSIVGGDIEVVAVLYDDKPATLLVNEDGIQQGLVPNARATLLYWTATIQGSTGADFDPLDGPLIHGNAILLPVDKRRL